MKKIIIAAVGMLMLQMSFAQTKLDRSKRPVAGPAPKITITEPVIFDMPNGLKVLVVENHKLPKVRASLNIDWGLVYEGKKAGVMDLMGQMLGEGTKTMTKAEFDEATDIIGADVFLSSSGGAASALTRYFDKAFSLMGDALRNPAFPQESFDKLKSQTITGLKSQEKSTSAIAGRVSSALNYGKNTAQGEFTTEESVKALTLKDIQVAYENYITPSRAYLTFVGDITPDQAKTLANKIFGNWTGKKLELPKPGDAVNPQKTEIDFVDVPTAVQGEMSMGNLIKNPMNGKDYFPLLLANQILGGGADSKLFMNLREKHGFTYGAYSSTGSGRFQSLFKASSAVRTEKVDSAINEVVKEIINMRDGNITQEELDIAKAKFNGSYALRMEDPSITATYASNILINNLPKDFYSSYLQKINSITIDDIKRVSKTYFNETNSRIVIVGNAKKIIPNLARLGFPIKKYDRYADPVVEEAKETDAAESAKTTDAVSGFSIIEDYLKAVGGKAEIEKVTSVKAVISMDMMGRSFSGNFLRLNPSKTITEIKMGDMTVMKMLFNGETGYNMQMGNKTDLNENEIKEQGDEKSIVPQLFYNTAAYKTEYLGKGKVSGEETYRLKVVMPSGRTSVQQFAIKSGLLLQEETTTLAGDAEASVSIEYKNYQKVGNILMATQIVRSVEGQEFTVNLSDIKFNEGVTDTDFK
ncbi:MAG: insulinase family protein [Chitinophagaceae bacterium]|nr:insulinase family protein [Chitinophagaceae bacterium]